MEDYGLKFHARFEFKNAIIGEISSVKVDFIRHNYQYINPPIKEEGVTFLSMQDIAAMKVNVLTDSGKRLKDFIDLYYLLEYYSFKEVLEFYQTKYPLSNAMIAAKAITYFDDIDFEMDPPNLKVELPFLKIKERLISAMLKDNLIFKS